MIPGVGAGGGGAQDGPRPVAGGGPSRECPAGVRASGGCASAVGAPAGCGVEGVGGASACSGGTNGGGCCRDQPGSGSGPGCGRSPRSAPSAAGPSAPAGWSATGSSPVGISSGSLSVMDSYPIVALATSWPACETYIVPWRPRDLRANTPRANFGGPQRAAPTAWQQVLARGPHRVGRCSYGCCGLARSGDSDRLRRLRSAGSTAVSKLPGDGPLLSTFAPPNRRAGSAIPDRVRGLYRRASTGDPGS